MAVLITNRYGTLHNFNHSTVKSAAISAVMVIENNEAMPVEIKEGELSVWRNLGMFSDSYEKLRILACLLDDDDDA